MCIDWQHMRGRNKWQSKFAVIYWQHEIAQEKNVKNKIKHLIFII